MLTNATPYPAGTATLWQRCHNVVVDVATTWQVENESCVDDKFRRFDNVALQLYQDTATMLQCLDKNQVKIIKFNLFTMNTIIHFFT